MVVKMDVPLAAMMVALMEYHMVVYLESCMVAELVDWMVFLRAVQRDDHWEQWKVVL
jgi:hypothetical protein